MTDPHRHDDAAYVLGALSPDEREAFEAHLRTCAECLARVAEIETVPAMLAGIDAAELEGAPGDTVPDTLLPAMLREARRGQRRQRWLVGALATVAAACVVALVIALWPSSSTPSSGSHRKFVAVAAQSPVSATATLTAKPWGTEIDVRCHYVSDQVDHYWSYDLVAYDRQGNRHRLGDWRLPPDSDIDYRAGTSLLPSEIASLVITLPDGTAVLKLTT